MSDTSPAYLTLSQVATRTRRHPELLRQWCASGRIPCQRVGGSWVLREEDVALLDGMARRSRRRPARRTTPSGRTRLLAAIFDDASRADGAAASLMARRDLSAGAIETAPLGLRTLGSLGLTVIAGPIVEEGLLEARRLIAGFGGRIVADIDSASAAPTTMTSAVAPDGVRTAAGS